jgi:hypothetical protein
LSNSFWKIPENIKVAWKTISYLWCLKLSNKWIYC